MKWRQEWKPLTVILTVFVACFFLPVGAPRFDNALMESLQLVKWYAREHVILCLVPAFFIAGAISVFVSQASVMKYLGPGANKVLAYGVASVSGSVLAVCSCTVLPLFGGIYRMGAGLGPACTFLYSGPAINVLAIILSARVLGMDIGIARAVGAVAFSVVIGLAMHVMFRREEQEKARMAAQMSVIEAVRPLWQTAVYFASMVAILVFANWGRPEQTEGAWYFLYSNKWTITVASAIPFGLILWRWFGFALWKLAVIALPTAIAVFLVPSHPVFAFAVGAVGFSAVASTAQGEVGDWFDATWEFAKQIVPLLLAGVLISGFLLGRPGQEGLIPSAWVSGLVGGNSFWANLFASVVGAFMYFATLTEVPIVQGLIGSGMGKGPALALLLAGPALSLPSMLVIRSILGTKKTLVYTGLVIVMSTITGQLFGLLAL